MNIYFNLNEFKTSQNTVVTVGTFDGLHLGHQAIFDQLKQIASEQNYRTVLITFSPHPAEVLKTKDVQIITALQEKISVFKKMKIDYMIVIPFSKEFSQMSYLDFLDEILIKRLKMKHLVFGYDHSFGKNREGTFKKLQKLTLERNFDVSQVSPLSIDDLTISSTLIRKLISEGKIEESNSYLGHPFLLFGKVVKGDARGRELGFRTANIESLIVHKLTPGFGVYFVKVSVLDEDFFGMCNVGLNPTFEGQNCKIEVHIFDFNKDIYEEEIGIYFLNRMRDEIKFGSKDELKEQLIKDEAECRLIINKQS